MQKRLSSLLAAEIISLLTYSFPGSAAADPASSDPMTLLAPYNQRWQREVLAEPKAVNLPNGVRAQTVVLRQTKWEPKNVPQQAGFQMEKRLMQLPEAERLKQMNRIDDHTQLWWVSLADFPSAGAPLKTQLRPEPLTNEYHRELAFLGKGHGLAWFGHMPIYEWIFLQQELHLDSGDDPLAGAARGLAIEDRVWRPQTAPKVS